MRWLLKRLNININSYYFYINHKQIKAKKCFKKKVILDKISSIYYGNNGTPGYRQMTNELHKENIFLSPNTVYSFMKELGLKSITRRKYHYKCGEAHKVFANLLQQNFTASKPNEKWCTDFTYLHLENGEKHYNCSILDLYDRSIVASICSNKIDAELAIHTLKKALIQENYPKNVILHSDQGSQYTSRSFTKFCTDNSIVQSMSKAGYPYDNAPMERFYNTLKVEFYYLYIFRTSKILYLCINDFIYTRYNHSRPHSFNNGLSPAQKRFQFIKSA